MPFFSLCLITVCPRSLDPIYVLTFYVKWDRTSWIESMYIYFLSTSMCLLCVSFLGKPQKNGIFFRRSGTKVLPRPPSPSLMVTNFFPRIFFLVTKPLPHLLVARPLKKYRVFAASLTRTRGRPAPDRSSSSWSWCSWRRLGADREIEAFHVNAPVKLINHEM